MMRILIFSILCLSTVTWAGDYFDTKILKLDAAYIKAMDVEAGAGFLYINGTTNADEIIVTAEIEISDVDEDEVQRILERDLELTLNPEGNRAVLRSKLRSNSWFSRVFKSAHVNLTVEVPENIPIYIDHGSGAIRISKMKTSIELDDGSGSIEMSQITGDLEIHDGSGEIDLKNIVGNIRIDDNSGHIGINDVKGDVDIDDGSGSIKVANVDGSVTIKDGSGSIDVEKVEDDVTIAEDSSGGVYISDVNGAVHRYDTD